MDFIKSFLSPEQIYALISFFVGIVLLNWCAHLERRDFETTRDPKVKWKYIDRGASQEAEIRRKSFRGWVMTIAGVGCALYGFISFLAHIN